MVSEQHRKRVEERRKSVDLSCPTGQRSVRLFSFHTSFHSQPSRTPPTRPTTIINDHITMSANQGASGSPGKPRIDTKKSPVSSQESIARNGMQSFDQLHQELLQWLASRRDTPL